VPAPAFVLYALLALNVHPIDRRDYLEPAQWDFVPQALSGAEVVALAESIHMTHELPLVRLGMLRALHERLGFAVVALEGSPVDAWVAQDRLLGTPDDAAAALDGLFPLWNTPEMRRLFAYETATWTTPRPLYVTSYDVQPGTGAGWPGPELFRRLAERIATYAPAPSGLDGDRLAADLGPLTGGCRTYTPAAHDAVEAALRALETWIGQAAPEVDHRHPTVPHAAVLALLPRNLRASLSLCDDLVQHQPGGYRARRDINAASYTLALKGTAPGGKLILWAHASHLRNTPGDAPTVGSVLRHSLGTGLYTVVTLAGSGGALVIHDDGGDEDVGYARIHGARGPLGARLAAASSGDYFLPLRGLSDPLFTTPQPIWLESGPVPAVLGEAFDGVLWVQKVHPPDWPLPRLLLLGSLHHRWLLATAVLALLLAAAVVWRRRRQRG
jgi:hypothetical protein